jgi:hypothetical protein
MKYSKRKKMRTLSIKSAELTALGARKFKDLENIARMRIAALLENSSEEIKKKVASFAPDEVEEAFALSYPGVPNDNFFKSQGGFQFLFLREAIKTEQIDTRSYSEGNVIKTYFGNVERLSSLIGFCWYHGSRGNAELRSTLDGGQAWGNLLERWELGGSAFTVTARDSGDLLTFYSIDAGERITVDSAEKYIPLARQPYTMYQSGGYFYHNTLLRRTRETLKESIAGAGFITL